LSEVNFGVEGSRLHLSGGAVRRVSAQAVTMLGLISSRFERAVVCPPPNEPFAQNGKTYDSDNTPNEKQRFVPAHTWLKS